MSIEGLWCFVSGDVESTEITNGGIVVLDSQRIYGGDSAIAYTGRYTVDRGSLEGEVETFLYNPAYADGVDVFGESVGPARHTRFHCQLNEAGFLVGELIRGEVKLPVILQKLRNLP